MFFALKFFKPPVATPGRIDTLTLIKQDTIIAKIKRSVFKIRRLPEKVVRQNVRSALFESSGDQLSPFSMDSLSSAIKELPRKTLEDISVFKIKADAYDTLELLYVQSVKRENETILKYNDLLRDYAQLNATIKQRRRRRWCNIGIAAGAGLLIGILIAK